MGDQRSANSGAGVLVGEAPMVDEIVDALAGPERRDAGMERRGGSVESEIRFVRLSAGASGETKAAGMALGDAAVEEKRLAKEKIGRTLGVDIGYFDAFERQLHISEDGTLDGFEEAAHLLANFTDIGNMRESAAAELRHFGGEEEVGSAANGNCVEACAAEFESQRGEDLLFVAEVAVRKQDDVAQVAGSFWLPHQVEERWKHLGAATCFKVLNETTCGGEIFRGGGQWLGGKFIIGVVEGEDAEAIVGAETVEGLEQRFASLCDGSAAHRAGDVNHVKHFHGHALDGLHGGRKGRQEEIGFAGAGVGGKEKSRLGLRAFGLLDFQDKIFIWNSCARGEFYVPAAVRQTTDGDRVRDRVDRAELEARVEIDGEGDVVAGTAVRIADRRSDSGGVRHGVGVDSPAGAGVADGLRAGNVARPHNQRENQADAPIFPAQGLHVAQADFDVVARHKVRYRSSEDVGALFFHESGALAFGLGGLVDAFGLFALANHASDQPIANADFHVVDSTVVR